MVSLGGKGGSSKQKSKSSNESLTRFPKDFWDDAMGYFGDAPEYNPEYVGFGDEGQLDKLQDSLYQRQKIPIHQGYQDALKIQNEELSNSGLLNSPSKYIEGGARDTLNKGYITSLQQAAREAALARLGVEQQEATRRTSFNEQTAMAILNRWLQRMGIATQAGRESSGSSSGSGSSWSGGFDIGFGS
jgi:hypothetical protein